MSSVNGEAAPAHVARLLFAALQRARAEGMALLAAEPDAVGAVTAARARLLDHLPAEGARVTELAARMRITKQALGQLATQLADRGYVETVTDPTDRRAKLIRPTPRGECARRAVCAIAAAVEDRWRREVGGERYGVFREVLAQIAESSPRRPDGPGAG